MLRHIVIYRLKDNSEAQKTALKEKFLSMRGKIPQLKDISAGGDIVGLERSFDFALVCDFESRQHLDEYQVHPEHILVRDYVRSVICASHSVDFII